ncbi:MAG: hypothetical protein ACRC9Q_00740 [Bacteroidales bacterium]
MSSCSPIEERDYLSNSFNVEDLKLEVVQSTPGSNGITLKMVTKGVTGYWDYGLNVAYTDEVSFIYPIPGKSTFTYYVTTPYIKDGKLLSTEMVSKSIDIEITKLDQELPKAYYDLVGEQLQGKTWVFDGKPGDGSLYWYMCSGDPSKYEGAWWNAGDCCPPIDYEGKMVFDLNGGANYTYYESKDASPVKGGKFAFNAEFNKLVINGNTKILGNEEPRGSQKGEYTIIKLTSDKLILHVPNNTGGTGWCWQFKPSN